MTCPFYVCDGRPSCALGEPDGRHCGPRQYPVSPCNLDEIGRGEAWRSVLAFYYELAALQEAGPIPFLGWFDYWELHRKIGGWLARWSP